MSESSIILVTIDDASLQALKKPFVQISPELAQVVMHLKHSGASAIGIDLIIPNSFGAMSELVNDGEPGFVGDMTRAVTEAGNVVLAELIQSNGSIEGPLLQWQKFPREANDTGFVNLTVDSDMCLRRQLLGANQLEANSAEQFHPSLSASVYSKAKQVEISNVKKHTFTVGDVVIPLEDEKLLVNYVGPMGTFPRLSFIEVLAAANGEAPLALDLTGAMVLIGGEFQSEDDSVATPYSGLSNLLTFLPASWLGYTPTLMPGVEVHANILATINDRAFITTPLLLKTPLLLLLFGVLLGSALTQVNLEAGAVITLLHHFAWKVFAVLAFCLANWQVEIMAMLVLGPVAYGTVFALRWRLVRRMMGLFKSEAIARAMELHPEQLKLQGEARVLTVFFSDIRGFTNFSEANPPRTVVRLLNEYFTAIVPVIEQHGGVINQYMGDGIMVLFGAPTLQADHAQRAVAAGLDVLKKVDELHDHWRSLGIESLRIGVGINTGNAIVGTVGSPRRLDYSAIGDTVNTASRIESATKDVGANLLISEQTLAALPADQRARWGDRVFLRHAINVKGKQEKLIVYSLSEPEALESILPGQDTLADPLSELMEKKE